MKNLISSILTVVAIIVITGCSSNKVIGSSTSDSSKRKAVVVTQTAEGALITSDERILFDLGSSIIKPNGEIFLQRVAKIVNEKTKASISIKGHTDNIGGASLNLALSERRAQATKAALIKNGVAAKRITAKGYGFSNPIADNKTAEGRQDNRRSEILILGETVENIGGASLADRLQEGLANFLKDAEDVMKKVFGN